MNILERLKSETAELHRSTEQYSYGDLIMSGRLSLAQYADLIDKNRAIHRHFESGLSAVEGLDALFGDQLQRRMKMDALDRDAARLGIGNIERHLPSFLPNDLASALGAMYVLEGSSLGGAVIARALSKIPEISETGAFDFYTFYGSELGSMWTSFGQIVVKFVEEHGQADALVESAKKTFESVQAVFSQSLESVA